MTWEHCGVEHSDDTYQCPECGHRKPAWTLHLGQTRVFQVARAKPHWIELRVQLDDGSLHPEPLRYEVVYGAGKVISGTMEDGDTVRIEGIKGGRCKLRFPDLDAACWEEWEEQGQGEPAPAPEVAVSPPAAAADWVELVLVGEDGHPLDEDPAYVLTCADGTTRRGFLCQGRARVDGLPPGACRIAFPDVDGQAWAVGPPEPVSEERALPPPAVAAPADWVELVLVGEDGEPLDEDPAYVLTCADGTTREGFLLHGRARLDALPAGACRVTFPGLDADVWS